MNQMPSWPGLTLGLTRPSTPSLPHEDVDARDKPAHDEKHTSAARNRDDGQLAASRALKLKSAVRVASMVAVATMLMSLLTAYATDGAGPDSLAPSESFCRGRYRRALGGNIHGAGQSLTSSALRQLPSGRRSPAPGRTGPAASAAG